MLRTSDLDYDLPESAIAATPAPAREDARLMVVGAGPIRDLRIPDLTGLLAPGDLVVRNRTRVVPARFVGTRPDTGAKAEGLFLREIGPGVWAAMIKTRRVGEGVTFGLVSRTGERTGVRLSLIRRLEEPGAWEVHVDDPCGRASLALLEEVGRTPLPPYILSARRRSGLDVPDDLDRARYQTEFAAGRPASVAAPTAGLHLTPRLEAALVARGVRVADVELQVGTGTFRTVETEFVEQHNMHEERCLVPVETAREVQAALARGSRVVCVGTTSARTLEAASAQGAAPGEWFTTRLLITPGYRFRVTRTLLTNFHLPRSTLMALVAAMLPGGATELRTLYEQALSDGYRFYSYGDAMLVLP
ncbi:MAG: tRNA preQ1(34) S-adenosylmethionine ribosyltransferase-isomerase QueA [Phycisphaerales bacterium]|nr:tRNA preQ1(34) S-adenosylmethionine ribosyltransferase-isomerase QueA [Phycisphaerales bacterium]